MYKYIQTCKHVFTCINIYVANISIKKIQIDEKWKNLIKIIKKILKIKKNFMRSREA